MAPHKAAAHVHNYNTHTHARQLQGKPPAHKTTRTATQGPHTSAATQGPHTSKRDPSLLRLCNRATVPEDSLTTGGQRLYILQPESIVNAAYSWKGIPDASS
ncbi:Hypothetical predicted protein [Pelobates cultripes]|uniref:Uncharacterized protein n=1 Tax=Pelobates cultripes TaxID=61616 RepID=A0AAD1SHZ7_PELCU|nr:Hypothetical predicted protein [Pelobates cultripes]